MMESSRDVSPVKGKMARGNAAKKDDDDDDKGKKNQVREFFFYSKLLGCKVHAVKGAKKDKCRSLGAMFGYWLQDNKPELNKLQRKELIDTVTALITRDGEPDEDAALAKTVRLMLAEERRFFALSSENTGVLNGRKKKNKLRLDALAAQMNALTAQLRKFEQAEARQRKKDELMAKAAGNEALLKALQAQAAKDAEKEARERQQASLLASQRGAQSAGTPSEPEFESKGAVAAALAPVNAESPPPPSLPY